MLVEDLAWSVSVGKQTDLVMLDFVQMQSTKSITPSSFGSSTNMESDSLRGNTLSWICAFLGDRSQTVHISLIVMSPESVPVSSGADPAS